MWHSTATSSRLQSYQTCCFQPIVCRLAVPLRRRQISQFVRDKRLSIALQASSQSWLWHVSQSSWCLPQVLDTRERGTLQRQTVVSIFMDMVFTGLGINIVHIFTVFLVDLFDQNRLGCPSQHRIVCLGMKCSWAIVLQINIQSRPNILTTWPQA